MPPAPRRADPRATSQALTALPRLDIIRARLSSGACYSLHSTRRFKQDCRNASRAGESGPVQRVVQDSFFRESAQCSGRGAGASAGCTRRGRRAGSAPPAPGPAGARPGRVPTPPRRRLPAQRGAGTAGWATKCGRCGARLPRPGQVAGLLSWSLGIKETVLWWWWWFWSFFQSPTSMNVEEPPRRRHPFWM